jgi:PhnB protein
MQVQTYLLFQGRCEEALNFYRDAIGATIQALMRYSESPEPPPPECTPARPDMVMHASL